MKIDKKTTGIIKGLSNNAYHDNRTHKSSSVLKTALKDPLEYYQVYIKGKAIEMKNQDALNLGNYIHTLLLEPEKINEEFVIFTGSRRAGREWEHFEFKNRGKIIITDSQQQLATKMCVQFSQAKIDMGNIIYSGSQLFTNGDAEESMFCTIDGMNIKVRTDYRVDNVIRDLKTTNATPNTKEEARDIVNSFGYDLSAALYVDALKEITGQDYEFQLVFVSKQDFKTNVYRVSNKTLEIGREKYKTAIELIKGWEKSGEYHSIKAIREV